MNYDHLKELSTKRSGLVAQEEVRRSEPEPRLRRGKRSDSEIEILGRSFRALM